MNIIDQQLCMKGHRADDEDFRPEQNRTTMDLIPNIKECRICLEFGDTSENLIQPCKCSGSVKYVHQSCLREWIIKKKQRKINKICCQICKKAYEYETEDEIKCRSNQTVQRQICREKQKFCVLVTIAVISFGILLTVLIIIGRQIDQPSAVQIIVMVLLSLILGSITAFMILKIVFTFVVKRTEAVVRVLGRRSEGVPERTSFTRIFPQTMIVELDQ